MPGSLGLLWGSLPGHRVHTQVAHLWVGGAGGLGWLQEASGGFKVEKIHVPSFFFFFPQPRFLFIDVEFMSSTSNHVNVNNGVTFSVREEQAARKPVSRGQSGPSPATQALPHAVPTPLPGLVCSLSHPHFHTNKSIHEQLMRTDRSSV